MGCQCSINSFICIVSVSGEFITYLGKLAHDVVP